MSPIDPTVRSADIELLRTGFCHNPHAILGAHELDGVTIFRTLQPQASSVAVRIGNKDYELTYQDDEIWVGSVDVTDLVDYRLVIRYHDDVVRITADPYRFLPSVGEMDQYLIGEGRHERLWEVLGAHEQSYTTPDGTVAGFSFAVWAPAARGVSVFGDFNAWNSLQYPMRSLGSSGIWEIFIPDIQSGTGYKFAVRGVDGIMREKADPMAFATEIPPATASKILTSSYEWRDTSWMDERRTRDVLTTPMSTYEVHLGSWKPGLSYRDLAEPLIAYLDQMKFTHVEFLPLAEHPFGGSWGYQVTSYFAPSSRFGSPDDLKFLIDELHNAGYGVIVDWVPGHFPKDEWALANFDGSALYEHPDPSRGEQPEWGTKVFNFGRSEVRNFLVANALFWAHEYHIDGLRVDAVASMIYLDYSRRDGEWTPNQFGGRENLEAVQFLQEMNATIHREFPGIVTIAEESTSWPGVTRPTDFGGLGFSLKWNMGWMNDALAYFAYDQIYRSYHHHDITFSLMYAWSEHFVLPISHDEVVHGKGSLWQRMPGDSWTKAAGLRSMLAYMWAHPGKKLLFMGQEFGQASEWSEESGLVWSDLEGWEGELHRGLLKLTQDLNTVYHEQPALWSQDHHPGGFSWIDANDNANNVLTFLRFGSDGSLLACLFNLSGSDRSNYRIGLPASGPWHEILNTDAEQYEGAGKGNFGTVIAGDRPWHGREHSAVVFLPANSGIWLRYEG